MTGPRAFRQQPPAHSPLAAAALAEAAATILGRADPRPALGRLLREEYGADHVLLTDSGTSALRAALQVATAAGGPAPVALPAYSCYDVATAAIGAGLPLTLYDVDPETLAPDLDSLERCLAVGARVVVIAPLHGVPVDWDRVTEVATRAGAILIEDAAQGHGARWQGRPLGSLAPLSVLSFARGKGWTGGSGGALLFRGPMTRDAVAAFTEVGSPGSEWRGWATATAQWALGRPAAYALPSHLPGTRLGVTRFHPPRQSRPMSRGAAALLLATHSAALLEAAARRATGRWFASALPRRPGVHLITPPAGADPGWIRFPLRLARGLEGFRDPAGPPALGISPGYPRMLAQLPAVQEHWTSDCWKRRWPGAERLVRELLTLPAHSLVDQGDRTAIIRVVEGYEIGLRPSTRS